MSKKITALAFILIYFTSNFGSAVLAQVSTVNINGKKFDNTLQMLQYMSTLQPADQLKFIQSSTAVCDQTPEKLLSEINDTVYKFSCFVNNIQNADMQLTLTVLNVRQNDYSFIGFVASNETAISFAGNQNYDIKFNILAASRVLFNVYLSSQNNLGIDLNTNLGKLVYLKTPDDFKTFMVNLHSTESAQFLKDAYDAIFSTQSTPFFSVTNITSSDSSAVSVLSNLDPKEIFDAANGKTLYKSFDFANYSLTYDNSTNEINVRTDPSGPIIGSADVVVALVPSSSSLTQISTSQLLGTTPLNLSIANTSQAAAITGKLILPIPQSSTSTINKIGFTNLDFSQYQIVLRYGSQDYQTSSIEQAEQQAFRVSAQNDVKNSGSPLVSYIFGFADQNNKVLYLVSADSFLPRTVNGVFQQDIDNFLNSYPLAQNDPVVFVARTNPNGPAFLDKNEVSNAQSKMSNGKYGSNIRLDVASLSNNEVFGILLDQNSAARLLNSGKLIFNTQVLQSLGFNDIQTVDETVNFGMITAQGSSVGTEGGQNIVAQIGISGSAQNQPSGVQGTVNQNANAANPQGTAAQTSNPQSIYDYYSQQSQFLDQNHGAESTVLANSFSIKASPVVDAISTIKQINYLLNAGDVASARVIATQAGITGTDQQLGLLAALKGDTEIGLAGEKLFTGVTDAQQLYLAGKVMGGLPATGTIGTGQLQGGVGNNNQLIGAETFKGPGLLSAISTKILDAVGRIPILGQYIQKFELRVGEKIVTSIPFADKLGLVKTYDVSTGFKNWQTDLKIPTDSSYQKTVSINDAIRNVVDIIQQNNHESIGMYGYGSAYTFGQFNNGIIPLSQGIGDVDFHYFGSTTNMLDAVKAMSKQFEDQGMVVVHQANWEYYQKIINRLRTDEYGFDLLVPYNENGQIVLRDFPMHFYQRTADYFRLLSGRNERSNFFLHTSGAGNDAILKQLVNSKDFWTKLPNDGKDLWNTLGNGDMLGTRDKSLSSYLKEVDTVDAVHLTKTLRRVESLLSVAEPDKAAELAKWFADNPDLFHSSVNEKSYFITLNKNGKLVLPQGKGEKTVTGDSADTLQKYIDDNYDVLTKQAETLKGVLDREGRPMVTFYEDGTVRSMHIGIKHVPTDDALPKIQEKTKEMLKYIDDNNYNKVGGVDVKVAVDNIVKPASQQASLTPPVKQPQTTQPTAQVTSPAEFSQILQFDSNALSQTNKWIQTKISETTSGNTLDDSTVLWGKNGQIQDFAPNSNAIQRGVGKAEVNTNFLSDPNIKSYDTFQVAKYHADSVGLPTQSEIADMVNLRDLIVQKTGNADVKLTLSVVGKTEDGTGTMITSYTLDGSKLTDTVAGDISSSFKGDTYDAAKVQDLVDKGILSETRTDGAELPKEIDFNFRAPQATAPEQVDVVALGDVHGQYSEAMQQLKDAGAVSLDQTASQTVGYDSYSVNDGKLVISLGDNIDRALDPKIKNPTPAQILDAKQQQARVLIFEKQAVDAGDMIKIAGNHDLPLLDPNSLYSQKYGNNIGDTARYDFDSSAYGKQLSDWAQSGDLKLAYAADGKLYMHAGMTEDLFNYLGKPQTANEAAAGLNKLFSDWIQNPNDARLTDLVAEAVWADPNPATRGLDSRFTLKTDTPFDVYAGHSPSDSFKSLGWKVQSDGLVGKDNFHAVGDNIRFGENGVAKIGTAQIEMPSSQVPTAQPPQTAQPVQTADLQAATDRMIQTRKGFLGKLQSAQDSLKKIADELTGKTGEKYAATVLDDGTSVLVSPDGRFLKVTSPDGQETRIVDTTTKNELIVKSDESMQSLQQTTADLQSFTSDPAAKPMVIPITETNEVHTFTRNGNTIIYNVQDAQNGKIKTKTYDLSDSAQAQQFQSDALNVIKQSTLEKFDGFIQNANKGDTFDFQVKSGSTWQNRQINIDDQGNVVMKSQASDGTWNTDVKWDRSPDGIKQAAQYNKDLLDKNSPDTIKIQTSTDATPFKLSGFSINPQDYLSTAKPGDPPLKIVVPDQKLGDATYSIARTADKISVTADFGTQNKFITDMQQFAQDAKPGSNYDFSVAKTQGTDSYRLSVSQDGKSISLEKQTASGYDTVNQVDAKDISGITDQVQSAIGDIKDVKGYQVTGLQFDATSPTGIQQAKDFTLGLAKDSFASSFDSFVNSGDNNKVFNFKLSGENGPQSARVVLRDNNIVLQEPSVKGWQDVESFSRTTSEGIQLC